MPAVDPEGPARGVEWIRAAERPVIAAAEAAGDPDAVMRRAAAAVALHTTRLLAARTGGVRGRRVLLLVGRGDNGGDALYAGVGLRRRGCAVDAVRTDPDRVHSRGLAAFLAAGGRMVGAGGHTAGPVPDVVLDAVVGLGGRGPLRAPAAELVARWTTADVPFLAVDLPTGVDADTGLVHDPHVRAAVTVTFGVRRRAHLLAAPECGRVEVADIGSVAQAGAPWGDDDAVEDVDPAAVGAWWPVPGPQDDKYTQGVVAVRAGSQRYRGAAVLCTGAAVAATSGMVRYVGPCAAEVLAARPEVVCHERGEDAGRAQANVVGPGAGTDAAAVAELDRVLRLDLPTVLDADALSCLALSPTLLHGRRAPVVLTPHAGEFARLSGVDGDRLALDRAGELRRYVRGLQDSGVGAAVLLKGRVTLVDDGSRLRALDAGTSWGATAGSGDVLAGILGALAAAAGTGSCTSADLSWCAAAAATVHARAAAAAALRYGDPGAPIGASELLAAVPQAIAGVRAAAGRSGTPGVGCRPGDPGARRALADTAQPAPISDATLGQSLR